MLAKVAGPPKLLPFTVAMAPVESASTAGVLNPAPCRTVICGTGVVTGGGVTVRLKVNDGNPAAEAVIETAPAVDPSVTFTEATPLPPVDTVDELNVADPLATAKLIAAPA